MIVLNVSLLSVYEQIPRGADIIVKCTGNDQVGDIAAELTAFVAAQAVFKAASEAYDSAKTDCKAMLAARNGAQKEWKSKLKALATKIETTTGADPEVVYSTGLDLKAPSIPEQLIEEAPNNLRVATNGTPGKTKLSAEPLPGALMYVIEGSPDPITADSWEELARPRKPSCTVEGAEPGKKSWYRMAAINGQGQGPWTEPVARPVM